MSHLLSPTRKITLEREVDLTRAVERLALSTPGLPPPSLVYDRSRILNSQGKPFVSGVDIMTLPQPCSELVVLTHA